MNQLRENPFLAGVIIIAIAACAGLGFLVSGAMSSHQGAMDAYGQAVQKLQGLQNRVPFPDAANLKSAETLRDAYKEKLEGLKSSFLALQVPLNPSVTPQQFQDTLRATVNDVASKADASGVKLPEGFFLGFDQYKDSLPSDKAAPFLDRQLSIIAKVIQDLIGPNPESPGIKSIDALARTSLPSELPAPAANPGQQKAPAPAELQKNSFTLGFTAEQGKFRIAFNNLLKSPQFLIVRSLSVKNSNPQGPPVVAAASETGNPPASAAALFSAASSPETPAAQSLNVILGRELLRVDMALEIVDFQVPAAGDKSPGTKPANP